MSDELKVVAYLVTGGRVFRDTAVLASEHALQAITRRNDGSTSEPLVRLSVAEAEIAALKEQLSEASKLLKRSPPATMGMYLGRDRKSFGAQAKELTGAIDSARAAGVGEGKR